MILKRKQSDDKVSSLIKDKNVSKRNPGRRDASAGCYFGYYTMFKDKNGKWVSIGKSSSKPAFKNLKDALEFIADNAIDEIIIDKETLDYINNEFESRESVVFLNPVEVNGKEYVAAGIFEKIGAFPEELA